MENNQIAHRLLSLHLNADAKESIRELLQKKNAGTITAAEQTTLEEHLVTGEFLDLLHARARRAVRISDSLEP